MRSDILILHKCHTVKQTSISLYVIQWDKNSKMMQ